MRNVSQRITAAARAGELAVSSWARGPVEAPSSPAWPVGSELRERMSVRWPASYEWPPATKWVEWLRERLERHVAVVTAEIPQQYEGIVMIEVDFDDRRHEVAIDYFDRERVLDEVVARCPLVFKMQYAREGYGHGHVVPGGYVPAHSTLFRYLPSLRAIRARGRRRYDLYGRFGSSYATGLRRTAVDLVSSQDRFHYEGALVLLPYGPYLREAALSHVCLDLPGNGDMCHRLVDYLAIGCCVVRPAPSTRLHVPLHDGEQICYCREDMSDLVEVCGELVDDPARSDRIGQAGCEYFDRYLHPDQMTGYYLDRCAAVFGGA
jgi:hypothetical protein